jgi:[methyl-Co(III) methanol-specific corrinoid protein]:coenzyme M methyltransferase
MKARDRVLNILHRKKVDRIPCFSGMGCVTVEGLKKYDTKFWESHLNPEKMAKLSASTFELFKFESAVVPFDLCVEAEALGCEINFYKHSEDRIIYPTIKSKIAEIGKDLEIPEDLVEQGRIPLVCEAIELLKDSVGDEVAIGCFILAPFTLAGQITDLTDLLKNSFKKPDEVGKLLQTNSEIAIQIAKEFKRAGADFITLREDGAPSEVISPRMFKSLIQPHLINVIQKIDSPVILHICGDTNQIVKMMWECGADAISVEQKNDIARSREMLGDEAKIFGNLDPFNTISQGTPKEIDEAVKKAINHGVDAVMPGCDLWPDVPPENIKAMVRATEKYGMC